MIDVSAEQLNTILNILRQNMPGYEVRAFGSRHKWTAKDYSDLDLAVVGETKLDWKIISNLKEAFEESDLPFRVDVLDWHAISPEFRALIEAGYEVIQKRQPAHGRTQTEGLDMEDKGCKTVKLKDCCTKIGSGATPRGGKEVYLDEGSFSLIRSQNVLDFFFSYNGLAFIDKDQAYQLSNVEIEEKDVLLNITGDSVARVCQVPGTLLPARVNQHVSIIRPDKSKLVPEFLKYFLLNPKFKNYMLGLASVGGTRNALTKGMIEDFEINLPSLSTQTRIAAILSALDDKIELNRQTNQTLEAIAQAIFKEWFVDFRFPGSTGEMQDSELGPIPKGWRVGKLGDIVELNPKLAIKKNSYSEYVEMKDISETSASILNHRKRDFTSGSKFQNGDTLLARITPCLENGKTGFVDFLPNDEIGWGSTEFIVLRAAQSISPYFIYCLSRHAPFRDFAIQSMVGSSGRQRVVESILTEFPVVIGGKAVHKKFTQLITPLFGEIKCNSEQSATLAAIRDALLPKLMNGEIEV